jgi:hypothetical protein
MQPEPEMKQPRNKLPRWGWVVLQAAVMFALFFLAFSWLQFSTPNLPDNDGYYHIRFAALMREQGLKPDFPYLPLTVLNEREFYDHHFLYHAALIPFTFGDLRLGAKWSAAFFASLAFLTIWWLLRGQGVPYAGLWSLGLLAVSQAFLYRMSVTRAQSLSLLVLALGLHWMLGRRYLLLAALGFVYVWMYDAFPLLPLMALIFGIGVWLAESRLEWRPLAWSAGGVALGLIVNLYFPFNLVFIFRHLLPKLAETTALSVGSEWFPYDTLQLVQNSGLALAAFLAGVLALGLRGERMDRRCAASLLVAILFGVMLMRARRFIEYFPPFALIFAAFAWKPLLERWSAGLLNPGPAVLKNAVLSRVWQRLPLWVLLAFVAGGMLLTLPDARSSVRSARSYQQFAGASAWLVENTQPGERIFQTDWDDFPRLFYYNTHNTYLIGLDPTYMHLFSPPLYDFWVQITRGEVDDISQAIKIDFGARYIISDLSHGDFLRKAAADPAIEEVYRDDNAIIFVIH